MRVLPLLLDRDLQWRNWRLLVRFVEPGALLQRGGNEHIRLDWSLIRHLLFFSRFLPFHLFSLLSIDCANMAILCSFMLLNFRCRLNDQILADYMVEVRPVPLFKILCRNISRYCLIRLLCFAVDSCWLPLDCWWIVCLLLQQIARILLFFNIACMSVKGHA